MRSRQERRDTSPTHTLPALAESRILAKASLAPSESGKLKAPCALLLDYCLSHSFKARSDFGNTALGHAGILSQRSLLAQSRENGGDGLSKDGSGYSCSHTKRFAHDDF